MTLDEFGLEKTSSVSVSVGDVFGRLLVFLTGQKPGTYRYVAVCRCRCGTVKPVRFDALQSGATTSCGCFHKEQTTTHGMTSSGHFGRWRHMMDRCYNERCRAWPDYGGRGIKVCDAWHDVATFVAELPSGYHAGLEIDRIDNDGNYEPGNVRWATRQQNTTNRRSARLFTMAGVTQSLTEWARETGLSLHLIIDRIDDLGWSVERALTEAPADVVDNMRKSQAQRWAGHTKKPTKESTVPRRLFSYQGADRTINEISALTGIDAKLLRKRLCERHWTVERATK